MNAITEQETHASADLQRWALGDINYTVRGAVAEIAAMARILVDQMESKPGNGQSSDLALLARAIRNSAERTEDELGGLLDSALTKAKH